MLGRLLLLYLALSPLACGKASDLSEGTETTGVGSGGVISSSGSGGAVGSSGSGGVVEAQSEQCGTVMLAEAIDPEETTEQAPTAQGGALRDGIYHAESYAVHGTLAPSKDHPYRQSFEIKEGGTALDLVRDLQSMTVRESYAVSLEGTTLTMTRTCPEERAGVSSELSYTATEAALIFFLGDASSREVISYDKQ